MKCPVCAADNEQGSSFCFRCGSMLQPATPPSATGPTVSLAPEARSSGGARSYASPTESEGRYDTAGGAAPGTGSIQGPPTFQPGQSQAYVMPGNSFAPVTNTSAVVSLVMSILSYFLLPVIGSIIGIILGYQARRSIRASNGRESGEGLATAGIILGWIHLALFVLLALVVCVFFAGIVGTSRTFS